MKIFSENAKVFDYFLDQTLRIKEMTTSQRFVKCRIFNNSLQELKKRFTMII